MGDREREKKKTMLICLCLYLFIHWLILACVPTGYQTNTLGMCPEDEIRNLGKSRQHSTQLSYLAKVTFMFLKNICRFKYG